MSTLAFAENAALPVKFDRVFLVGWLNQTALAFDDDGPMVLVAENDGVVFLGGKTGIDADAYQNNFRTRAMCR